MKTRRMKSLAYMYSGSFSILAVLLLVASALIGCGSEGLTGNPASPIVRSVDFRVGDGPASVYMTISGQNRELRPTDTVRVGLFASRNYDVVQAQLAAPGTTNLTISGLDVGRVDIIVSGDEVLPKKYAEVPLTGDSTYVGDVKLVVGSQVDSDDGLFTLGVFSDAPDGYVESLETDHDLQVRDTTLALPQFGTNLSGRIFAEVQAEARNDLKELFDELIALPYVYSVDPSTKVATDL